MIERQITELVTGESWILFIDGRSGSGKTSLALRLATLLDARVLHLDDLYPGWNGLAGGSAEVATAIRTGAYRRYDWLTSSYASERVRLGDPPWIIEGCGAITKRNLDTAQERAATVMSVWIDCPTDVRRARALERDGDTFRPHWDMWAAQEEEHALLHNPIDLATLTIPCH